MRLFNKHSVCSSGDVSVQLEPNFIEQLLNIGFSDWENLWTWTTIAQKSVFVYWCWDIINQSRYSIPKARLLSGTVYIYIVWHIEVKACLHVSYPFLLYALTKVNNIIVVIDSVPFRSPYEVNLSRCCEVRLQVKLGWKSDSNTQRSNQGTNFGNNSIGSTPRDSFEVS